jgi:hypothetical protein
LLLGHARAVTLRSKSRRTHGLILLSHLRLHQPGGPGPRISKSYSAVRNFQHYHWEGCMGSMQCNVEFGYQLSICSGTKENLDRVGRSQDLPIATDFWQQSSIKSANPTLVPTLCYCIFLFCFFFLFSSQQVILFLQLFACAYDLEKQQTIQNAYGRNKGICEQTRISVPDCSLEIRCFTR